MGPKKEHRSVERGTRIVSRENCTSRRVSDSIRPCLNDHWDQGGFQVSFWKYPTHGPSS
jgi:hypothetical protein